MDRMKSMLLGALACAHFTCAHAEQADPSVLARIGTGWMAHIVCSSVFVSERSLESVMAAEFGLGGDPALRALTPIVDAARKRVTVAFPEPMKGGVTAVYREWLGCTIAHGSGSADALQAVSIESLDGHAPVKRAWPEGMAVSRNEPDVDYDALDALMAKALEHGGELPGLGTRAVAVVHKGRLLAEGYADGFDASTPVYSASMSKTVTAMLVGILVRDGKLDMAKTGPRPEWRGDARRDISFDHLMRMVSGLEFMEEYTAASHVNIMLMNEPDMAAYAASHRALVAPGVRWSYSSGTSNIIMALARETFDGDRGWLNFPSEALFQPLGLRDTVFETDTSGTFVGSSFVWSTAQDYARLAQLLLQDGVWNGKRLLPEGWVDYMSSPHDGTDGGGYGAQTWLRNRAMPGTASNVIAMSGFGGQSVVMLRDDDIAVVRFAWDLGVDESFDLREFVAGVRSVLKAPES